MAIQLYRVLREEKTVKGNTLISLMLKPSGFSVEGCTTGIPSVAYVQLNGEQSLMRFTLSAINQSMSDFRTIVRLAHVASNKFAETDIHTHRLQKMAQGWC
jgi:hypothetical protein